MALGKTQKLQIVEEVSAQAAQAISMLAAEYSGMSVFQLTELRQSARNEGVEVRVVKNTLARRVLADTTFSKITPVLKGQVLLAFAKEGPGDAAKVFKKFVDGQYSIRVVGLSLGGDLLPGEALATVAKLPTREEALAILMATMQAPVTKLARTLNEVPGKLVRTIAAVQQQKEAA